MNLTEQERKKAIEELRKKYPEGERSALMDDFLDEVSLSGEDKKPLRKLKKLGIVEELK